MSDLQFDIIFRGDIVFGHQLADVKAKLQQLFKADTAKIDALFSGRPVPLKRGLDQASAQKYKDALIKAGAQVDIVPAGETKPAASPAPAKESQSAAPISLAQRLELQAEKAKQDAIIKEAEAKAAAEIAAQLQAANPQKMEWSLAPVGADLLQPTEKPVVVPIAVDTSALSLRAEGGNILDASEQPKIAVAAVQAPNYEVAEVGAILMSHDDRLDLPLLEIELEDWTLAELGEDLIGESEKIIAPSLVIQALDVGLAPVGSDLGQIKPQIKVQIPDVSGIRLAE